MSSPVVHGFRNDKFHCYHDCLQEYGRPAEATDEVICCWCGTTRLKYRVARPIGMHGPHAPTTLWVDHTGDVSLCVGDKTVGILGG